MGSPPREIQHLMRTSLSKETTPYSSRQSFMRTNTRARPESIGPHSGLYGTIQRNERRERMRKYHAAMQNKKVDEDDIYSVISEMSMSSKIETYGKVRESRPLSPVRIVKKHVGDDNSFYSASKSAREVRARASPYLKHLGERKREELLMELGSVSMSTDTELNAEMELKHLIKTALGPERRKPSFGRVIDKSSSNMSTSSNSNSHSNKSKRMEAGKSKATIIKGKSVNRHSMLEDSPAHTDYINDTFQFTVTGGSMSDSDDGQWWKTGFSGISDDDDGLGYVVDLSPSVSTASSDHSWTGGDITGELGDKTDEIGYMSTFNSTGAMPEDY
jgi:hypothetical protein